MSPYFMNKFYYFILNLELDVFLYFIRNDVLLYISYMRNVILLLIRTNFVVIFHPILLADINKKKMK